MALPIYSRWVLPNTWTPRTLAAKTFAALRKRPILALPVLAADALAFTANMLQRAITRWLVTLVIYSHASVLSPQSRAIDPSSSPIWKAAFMSAPVLWLFYFLSSYLYTLAFVATFTLLQQPNSGLQDMLTKLRDRRRLIIRFALKFWLLLIPAAIAAGLLLSLLSGPLIAVRAMGFAAGASIGFLMEVAVAWIMIPSALRLLTGPVDNPPHAQIHPARLAAVAALFTQLVFLIAIPQLTTLLPGLLQQSGSVGIFLRDGAMSLLGAAPYFLLFIALSILANSEPAEPALS